MSQRGSPSTGRPDGLARTCQALALPRSTVYAVRARRRQPAPAHKRGPQMAWTDATTSLTDAGSATSFVLVDHYTAACVGIHAARRGTRFEALEPLHQGIRAHFGAYGEQVASGLALRHDHARQFLSDLFQAELRFLGIASSPAFVREPKGNGCAARFIFSGLRRLSASPQGPCCLY